MFYLYRKKNGEPMDKRTDRLNVRIKPSDKNLIDLAASYENLTTTEFVVKTLIEKSQRTLSDKTFASNSL